MSATIDLAARRSLRQRRADATAEILARTPDRVDDIFTPGDMPGARMVRLREPAYGGDQDQPVRWHATAGAFLHAVRLDWVGWAAIAAIFALVGLCALLSAPGL